MPSIQQLKDERAALVARQNELIAKGNQPDADLKALKPELQQIMAEVTFKSAELQNAELTQGYSTNSTSHRTAPDIVMSKGWQNAGGGQSSNDTKSIGQILTESPTFKNFDRMRKAGPTTDFDVELKTLLTTTNWATDRAYNASGTIKPVEQRPTLLNLIPSSPTSEGTVAYMEETTTTSAAETVAEGAEKPEAALAFTEREDDVRKIAVHIPVTTEQLADVPGMRQYLDQRLGEFVMAKLEDQILNGNGTTPNISGIFDRSIQTQAKGADTVPDAILKAITKVQVAGGAEPNVIILHPNDMLGIRLLTTADGIYLFDKGSLWDIPVITTTRIAENTGLVGYTGSAQIRYRSGLSVAIGTIANQFIENEVTVLCEIRATLQVFSPLSWCSVTGI